MLSTASSRLMFSSSACRHSSYFQTLAFDRSGFFFRLRSITPARILVPPISTARMASCALNIQLGARCAAPIRPASSGSLRTGTRSISTLSAFRMTARTPDHQLADPARPEAAADHDALGVLPAFQLEEAPDHQRQLLREILDRAMQNAGSLGVALAEQFVELLLGQILARRLAERVVAGLAQGLAPILDDLAERALAGAVADKALVVLDLEIVAVDVDRRQPRWRRARQRRAKSSVRALGFQPPDVG